MNRQVQRIAWVGAAGLLMSGLVGAPSWANGRIDHEPAGLEQESSVEHELTEDEALRADAEHYARDYGTSVEEAFSRLAMQQTYSEAFESLQDRAPETFIGVHTSHEPVFGVTVYLAGDRELDGVREVVTRVNQGSATPVRIDTSRSLSDAQIGHLLTEQGHVFEGAVDGDIQALGYDMGTDEFTIEVTDSGGASNLTSSGLKLESIPLGDGTEIDLRARVDYLPEPAADGYRGGFAMSSCTAGFNIVVNGTRGMTTSGHCGNSQSYRTFSSSTWNSTTFRSQALNANADIQWHTTTLTPGWAFHGSSTSSTQLVTGRTLRTSQSGVYICHRGKTTGYSCGTVNNTSYRPTYSGACGNVTCNAVFVAAQGSSLRCYPGDSGGPVFAGGRAYGWYKGQASSGTTASQCTRMFWMAPDYLNAISGASLLTAP